MAISDTYINHYFFHDWTDPKNGYRKRLVIAPRAPWDSVWVSTTPPAFGSTGASGWHRIPDDALATGDAPIAMSGASYNGGLPIGFPTTPTMAMRVDLARLSSSAALTALRGYLQTPYYYSDGVVFSVSSSYDLTSDSTNIFTLYSDRGNSALTVANFSVDFQGAQSRYPAQSIECAYTEDSAVIELEVIHIAHAVLERIPPEAIAQYAVYNQNTTTYVGGAASAYAQKIFYDVVYDSGAVGSTVYGIASNTRGGESDRFRCRTFSLQSLSLAIESLATSLYRNLMRDSAAEFLLQSASYTTGATPFDHWTFYARDYTQADGRGASLTAATNLYFIGAGWKDATQTHAVGTTALHTAYDAANDGDTNDGDVVLGLYSPHDAQSIHGYANAYDLLVDLAGGGLAKVVLAGDADTVSVYFAKPGEGSTVTLTLDEIVREPSDPVPVMLGSAAGIIRDCPVTLPDAEGEDVATFTRPPIEGSLAEQDVGVELFFHHCPPIRQTDDYWLFDKNRAGFTNDDIDSGADYVMIALPSFSCRKLYYYADAGTILNNDKPILPHPQVTIDLGFATATLRGETVTWVTPAAPRNDPAYKDIDHAIVIESYRDRSLLAQTKSCTMFAVNSAMRDTFASPYQWKLTEAIPQSKGVLRKLGDKIALNDSGGSTVGLSIFARETDVFVDVPYPKHGMIVSVAEADGDAEVSIIGVAT